MSAKVIYLDNREALLAALDTARLDVVGGSVSSLAIVVCYEDAAGVPTGRSVAIAIKDNTLERDRLVMGAELLKHQLLIAEEEDAQWADDEPPNAS